MREQAEDQGRHNLPSTDARQLDGPQHSIVQFIESEIQRNLQNHRRLLVALNRRIDESNVEAIAGDAESLPRRLRQELDALHRKNGPPLEALRRSVERKEAEYESFRHANGLVRDPDYPESRFWFVAILIFTVLLEGILNAYFFRLGSEFGIVGGAIQAFLLAFIDVAIVFSLGLITRFIWAKELTLKVVGMLAGVASITWVLLYNLAVAHYRELLQGQEAWLAMEAIVGRLSLHPLGLIRGDSWLLYVLGAFFSGTALVDGLLWFDDRIPFYGRKHRKLVQLRDDLLDERKYLEEEGTELRDRALEQLATYVTKVNGAIIALNNAIEVKLAHTDRLRAYIELCEGACNTLISIYRTENQRHRHFPPPAYFNQKWAYPVPHDLKLDRKQEGEGLSQQQAARARFLSHRTALSEEIENSYESFLETLGIGSNKRQRDGQSIEANNGIESI